MGSAVLGTLFDHLGTVREMCDSTGVIKCEYAVEPFGRIDKLSETVPSDNQFADYYLHAPQRAQSNALPILQLDARSLAQQRSCWHVGTGSRSQRHMDSGDDYWSQSVFLRNERTNFTT